MTLDLLHSRTVATSITRMVIFIRAVQSLKTDYETTGANLRKYARIENSYCANDLCAVITTAGLYWSMIESGLGLTSACLPTIYALTKRKPSFGRLGPINRERDLSMSSDVGMVAGLNGATNMDTHALKEPDPVLRKGEPPDGQIMVKKSFQTTENVV